MPNAAPKRAITRTYLEVYCHLLVTEDNYEPPVAALSNRYWHPGLLTKSHLVAIKAFDAVCNANEL